MFSYVLARVYTLSLAFTFVVWAVLLFWVGRRKAFAFAVTMSLALVLFAWQAPTFPTTPRKQFVVVGEGIKEGDSMDEVWAKLGRYENWSTGPGHVSFVMDDPSNWDVVVIHFDPDTKRVTSAHVSLD